MPHSPTPPAPRKPPSGIIESVGASRMSSWFTRSSIGKSPVRENTAIAPARIAKARNGTKPTGDPNARYRTPHTIEIGRISSEMRTRQPLARPRVLVVGRIRADPRRARQQSLGERPGAHEWVHAETVPQRLAAVTRPTPRRSALGRNAPAGGTDSQDQSPRIRTPREGGQPWLERHAPRRPIQPSCRIRLLPRARRQSRLVGRAPRPQPQGRPQPSANDRCQTQLQLRP